ncbi:hypothetical protein ACGFZL_14860 [Streptomyces sp. NPDC048182]|uniref:hypothetical protein n=1 Tax=Streptomyces sp. NPDC048182 TaxID=3365507 RepID=UPI0037219463
MAQEQRWTNGGDERVVETVVLAANTEGLRFAVGRGFVERERYVLDGEREEWVDLRLADDARER